MKSVISKRIGAYIIDSILVSIIVVLLIQIPFVNPYLDKYEDINSKYTELEKNYEKKKISNKEYKIESRKLTYKMDKYNFSYSLIMTASLFGYFVLFQYYNNGQTVGKKVMKIRIKGKNNKKLKFINYFIRGILLNSIITNVILMLFLFIKDINMYYYLTTTVSVINSVFMYLIFITLLFRSDNRGLHDILANTTVVEDKEYLQNK